MVLNKQIRDRLRHLARSFLELKKAIKENNMSKAHNIAYQLGTDARELSYSIGE